MSLASDASLAAWHLAAVVVLAGALPAPGAASADARGTTVTLALTHASHPVPRGAPTTVAYLPPGAARGAPQVLVVLHGWTCCAATMIASEAARCAGRVRPGWGLGARVDESDTASLLLVPQLSLAERDGSAGRFAERGFFGAWLAETLDALAARLPGGVDRWRDAPVALVAHSAGFETALAITRDPSSARRVHLVALLDALYAGAPALARWVVRDPARHVLSVHTGAGRTRDESARLASLAQRARTPGERVARVRIEASRAGHGALPGLLLTRIAREFAAQRAAGASP